MTILTFLSNCGETSATTGTSDIVLSDVAINRRQVLPATLDGLLVSYLLEDGGGTLWEEGTGIYTDSTKTIARTTVTDGSSGTGNKITLTGNTHKVTLTVPASWFNDMEKYHDVLPGTAFPATPVDGMMFYHQTRKILYVYEQAWVAVELLGDVTIYVDKTGTDDSSHGFASGTDAYLTVQYAIDAIPPLVNGNVTVSINDGTYSEAVVINGKNLGGNYEILLIGATTEQVTGTFSSTPGVNSFADTSKTWSTDEHKHRFLEVTSGSSSGTWGAIASNTSSEVGWFGHSEPNSGYWEYQYPHNGTGSAPASGDGYKIHSNDVTIKEISVQGQLGLGLESLNIGSGTPAADYAPLEVGLLSSVSVRMCKIVDSGKARAVKIDTAKIILQSCVITGGTTSCVNITGSSAGKILCCVIDNLNEGTNSNIGNCIDASGTSFVSLLSTYCTGSSTANCKTISARDNSVMSLGWSAETGSYCTGAPAGSYDGHAHEGGGLARAINTNNTLVRSYTTTTAGWVS